MRFEGFLLPSEGSKVQTQSHNTFLGIQVPVWSNVSGVASGTVGKQIPNHSVTFDVSSDRYRLVPRPSRCPTNTQHNMPSFLLTNLGPTIHHPKPTPDGQAFQGYSPCIYIYRVYIPYRRPYPTPHPAWKMWRQAFSGLVPTGHNQDSLSIKVRCKDGRLGRPASSSCARKRLLLSLSVSIACQ